MRGTLNFVPGRQFPNAHRAVVRSRAELGSIRIEYDGAIATNGASFAGTRQDFGALSGTRASTELMESFLKREHKSGGSLRDALKTALDAWTVARMALRENEVRELPAKEAIANEREKHEGGIEAAILERSAKRAIRYRPLADEEIVSLTAR